MAVVKKNMTRDALLLYWLLLKLHFSAHLVPNDGRLVNELSAHIPNLINLPDLAWSICPLLMRNLSSIAGTLPINQWTTVHSAMLMVIF